VTFVAWDSIFFFFSHTLGSFGQNTVAEVSAYWNIIVASCNTLTMWFGL